MSELSRSIFLNLCMNAATSAQQKTPPGNKQKSKQMTNYISLLNFSFLQNWTTVRVHTLSQLHVYQLCAGCSVSRRHGPRWWFCDGDSSSRFGVSPRTAGLRRGEPQTPRTPRPRVHPWSQVCWQDCVEMSLTWSLIKPGRRESKPAVHYGRALKDPSGYMDSCAWFWFQLFISPNSHQQLKVSFLLAHSLLFTS